MIPRHIQQLHSAARLGDVAALGSLLSSSPALSQESVHEALCIAAHAGQAGLVEVLLPHTDASLEDSMALSLAALGGHAEVVALLAPHCDIPRAARLLVEDYAWEDAHAMLHHLLPRLSDQELAEFASQIVQEQEVHAMVSAHLLRRQLDTSMTLPSAPPVSRRL